MDWKAIVADILRFNGITTLDLPTEQVLEMAKEAGLTDVVVIGYDKDGDEYFASSKSDGGDVLWLLERAKYKLLTLVE